MDQEREPTAKYEGQTEFEREVLAQLAALGAQIWALSKRMEDGFAAAGWLMMTESEPTEDETDGAVNADRE